MLAKKNRLRRKSEFAYIYRKGKAFHTKYLTMIIVPTKSKVSKVGFSVSNKVGNSIIRHKLKRRLSEIIRKKVNELPIKNYIFVAKNESNLLSFVELEKEISILLKKVEYEE